MSKTTTFVQGQGLNSVPQALIEFMLSYAKEKNVPIHNVDSVRPSNVASVVWHRDKLLFGGAVDNLITVQDFLAACDSYNVVKSKTKTITLGSYRDVLLDAEKHRMVMNGEHITFDTIRRVYALSQEAPATDGSMFENNDSIVGSDALLQFLYEYAVKRKVNFRRSIPSEAKIPTNGKGWTGLRYTTGDESSEGLLNYKPVEEKIITAQQFIRKCDNYTDQQRFSFKVSENYKVGFHFDVKNITVGCQRISFDRLAELVKEIDELEKD